MKSNATYCDRTDTGDTVFSSKNISKVKFEKFLYANSQLKVLYKKDSPIGLGTTLWELQRYPGALEPSGVGMLLSI